jgi:hypothetical protein
MNKLRELRKLELAKVAEVIDRNSWLSKTINRKIEKEVLINVEQRLKQSKIVENDLKQALTGGLLTYLLHW